MVARDYTYFGDVFDRLMRSRGYTQTTFAEKCRQRGYVYGKDKKKEISRKSVSDWFRGEAGCPREVPTYADQILEFDDDERMRFALAYAYGQTIPAEQVADMPAFGHTESEREDIEDFRTFLDRARMRERS